MGQCSSLGQCEHIKLINLRGRQGTKMATGGECKVILASVMNCVSDRHNHSVFYEDINEERIGKREGSEVKFVVRLTLDATMSQHRVGILPRERSWYLYLICVCLQCLFPCLLSGISKRRDPEAQ